MADQGDQDEVLASESVIAPQSNPGPMVLDPQSSLQKKYTGLEKIGQGKYGEVFKARNTATNEFVAMKLAIRQPEEEEEIDGLSTSFLTANFFDDFCQPDCNELANMPVSFHREMTCLQRLHGDNIVKLLEIYQEKDSQESPRTPIYLVIELCQHDLRDLLNSIEFSPGEIKGVLRQLFEGLRVVHLQKILHRDLKPANILITSEGVIKIADFGMARDCPTVGQEGDASCLTHPVVSRWYRAPELLLRASKYSYPIDLWAAGCVMAEMWTQKPLMKGDNDRDQLELITKLCGSIKPEVWPGVDQYLLYEPFQLQKDKERKLKKKLQSHIKDTPALDLLDKLLVLNPVDRPTCEVALKQPYFHSEPAAADLKLLLSKPAISKMESLTLKD